MSPKDPGPNRHEAPWTSRFATGFACALALFATSNPFLANAAEPAPISALAAARIPPAATATVAFARDILPLLEARCFECHGPNKQKADLRLDRQDAALKGGESGPVLVPGKSAESLLVHLVAGLDPDRVMPPKGEPLTPREIGLLRAWIDQGISWPAGTTGAAADAESHWAFQLIQRPPVPTGAPTHPNAPPEARPSPIDAFIRAGLAKENLAPSPEAPRTALIRRLYLVMLGVPPTYEETQRFVANPDPRAFEHLVDQVLADGRYGERWARHWLDIIRFAESNGFETNRERVNAWRFRDYVIAAFNQDTPYDRFIREQIAGDTLGIDVATGFLVAGPVDIVGSPDPVLTAQQRADELDDMVNTTGTAFLGLTLGCARCHAHKFDPIDQREYYSLTAVFSGVKHGDRALPLPPERAAQVAALGQTITNLELRLAPFLVQAASPTAPASATASATATATTNAAALRPAVDPKINTETFPAIEARFLRFTILASSSGEPCLDELEVYAGERNVALATNGAKATASGTLPGYDIHRLEHLNDGQTGNSRSWISHEAGRGWVQLEFPTVSRIERVVWGRDRSGGFGDRVPTDYRIEVATEPGQWKAVASSADRRPFAPGTPKAPEPPRYDFARVPEAEAVRGRAWLAELESTRKRRAELAQPTMVYAGTFQKPTAAYRLHRGDPMQKREPVAPATLSLFEPLVMSPDEPEAQRRVKLADWITNPRNPLTARVLVNRLWQYQFGVGLVDTPNDFGRAGSRPTHPELLDWLASEFIARGWSIKALQREILLSATWRQASTPRPEALRVDAATRRLWRFPPRRLEAEAIRDNLLAASGALDATAGGPSFHLHEVDRENVYHYQPKDRFTAAEFRRMIYAYKVRMEHDAIFGTFDCPDGSLVVPRRSVSTTPLQALSLFNSQFVLQQSELLASRVREEAGDDPARQVERAWQVVYNREPAPAELTEARDFANHNGLPALARALLNSNEFLFLP